MALYENQFDAAHDMPARSVEKSLIICSTPRVGSHMLGHALHRTGAFGFPLEYANPVNLARWKEQLGASGVDEVIRRLMARRTSPDGVFSIKVHYTHLNVFGGFQNFLAMMPSPHFLLMYRRDVLAQAISLAIAEQTGVWISGQTGTGEKPVYDYELIDRSLRSSLQQINGWRYLLAGHGIPFLELNFDEVRRDVAAAIRVVAEFAAVDTSAVQLPAAPVTKRQSADLNSQWRERFLEDHDRERVLEPLASRRAGFVRRLVRRFC